jgi:hypothetical protein
MAIRSFILTIFTLSTNALATIPMCSEINYQVLQSYDKFHYNDNGAKLMKTTIEHENLNLQWSEATRNIHEIFFKPNGQAAPVSVDVVYYMKDSGKLISKKSYLLL